MPEDKSKRTILVVEDEYAVRRLTRLLLERRGYQVLTAADGTEGLILAKVEQPDVILLDLMMPKMEGHDVLQRLKSDPDTKDAQVIMVGTKSDNRDRNTSLHLGEFDYVVKPWRTSALLQ